MLSCTKDDDIDTRTYPRVNTLSVTNVQSTGATFHAELVSVGSSASVVDHGFVWDTRTAPNIYDNTGMKSMGVITTTGVFEFAAPFNLTTGTKYYVRAYAKDSKTIMYGTTVIFVLN